MSNDVYFHISYVIKIDSVKFLKIKTSSERARTNGDAPAPAPIS